MTGQNDKFPAEQLNHFQLEENEQSNSFRKVMQAVQNPVQVD